MSVVLKDCRDFTTPSSFLKPQMILGTPTRNDCAHHFISLCLVGRGGGREGGREEEVRLEKGEKKGERQRRKG